MLNQEDLRSYVESCSVGVESHRPSLYIAAKPALRCCVYVIFISE